MSLLTTAIGSAKKVKHALKDELDSRTPVYLSPVRRIERVKTGERICAMTFDDGPMALPPSPDRFGGKALTLVLLETLEAHGAKGTFDVIGDTSSNYPDKPGKHGSASWGGVAYDHYPDIHKDGQGGAVHCPELIARILSGGHQITNHTYSHVIFGRKAVVYGSRKHLNTVDEAIADMDKLDRLLLDKYGYRIGYTRPPHYVDAIPGGFSSYDACAVLGLQYMAASFDGAGWLPLKTYDLEVEAVWKPIEAALAADPDALRGQIIFQKDGYNMARRTPIADGLPKALEMLDRYGYRVVTVQELMERGQFEDAGPGEALYDAARYLVEKGRVPVFRNNKLLPDTPATLPALLMMLHGWEGAKRRIALMKGQASLPCADMKPAHPYSGAVSIALERGEVTLKNGKIGSGPLDEAAFQKVCRKVYGRTVPVSGPLTHGKLIMALARLEGMEG